MNQMRNLYTYNRFLKINESSFFNFENDDILTDEYITNFIKHEDYTSEFLDLYIEKNDIDEDENEVRDSSEFREFIKNILEYNLNDAKENIHNVIDYDTNKITIYRAITVDDNWINHLKSQGKRLGIFWAWDERAAETHWGDYKKKKTAVIKTSIDEKYVDWIDTFELNTHPNSIEEREIRLFKNTPLKIESITIDDEEIDMSQFGDKTFYA